MQSNEYNSTHVYFSMGRFTPTFTEDILLPIIYLTKNRVLGVELDSGYYIWEDSMLSPLHETVKKSNLSFHTKRKES